MVFLGHELMIIRPHLLVGNFEVLETVVVSNFKHKKLALCFFLKFLWIINFQPKQESDNLYITVIFRLIKHKINEKNLGDFTEKVDKVYLRFIRKFTQTILDYLKFCIYREESCKINGFCEGILHLHTNFFP